MAKRIEIKGGLEWALENLAEQPIQPGEFSAGDFSRKAGTKRTATANLLGAAEQRGELKSRIVTLNGRRVRVYRKV